jgi:hypothetical protein
MMMMMMMMNETGFCTENPPVSASNSERSSDVDFQMPMACNNLKPVVTNDIDASDGFNTSNKPEEGTVQ